MRVGAAAQLLTETDLSILDIGFKAGFGNYSNFNLQFKRIKAMARGRYGSSSAATEPGAK